MSLALQIEKDIYVDLSARQRKLYRALLANVSVADLLEKAANIGDADSARSLMNLVMQFRKVYATIKSLIIAIFTNGRSRCATIRNCSNAQMLSHPSRSRASVNRHNHNAKANWFPWRTLQGTPSKFQYPGCCTTMVDYWIFLLNILEAFQDVGIYPVYSIFGQPIGCSGRYLKKVTSLVR
jgi:hypothetical protein